MGFSDQKTRNISDSVALESIVGNKPEGPGEKGSLTSTKMVNVKILVTIFFIFVLVVSDIFTSNVVSGFRGAVRCRSPTSFGVVVQGIFLVIFYVLALHLIDGDII
jgi:hypothetical protein